MAGVDQRAFKWIPLKAPKLIGSKKVSTVVREKPLSTISHDAPKMDAPQCPDAPTVSLGSSGLWRNRQPFACQRAVARGGAERSAPVPPGSRIWL